MSDNANDKAGTSLPGERAAIDTGHTAKHQAMLKKGIMVAVLVVAIGWLGFSGLSSKEAPDPEQKKVVIRQSNDFEPAPKPANAPVPVAAAPVNMLPSPTAPAKAEEERNPLLESSQRAPLFSSRKGSANQAKPSDNAGDGDSAFVPYGDDANPDARKFDNLMKPTVLQGSRAGHLGNRNFIIAMGTSIPCVLETALASDQPGFTSCVINRDILSDNGRVVLMEKGTQIVGEYRGGLQRGQKRLFVLWNRAKTPKGVIVQLASPATDAIGRAGFDGYVNTHWWERFGSALLLSMVGDLTSWATGQLDQTSISAENTSEAGRQAAAIAVEQSINIPPTLQKHQGELVSIFVARDLDFSSVYKLRVTEPQSEIYDRAVTGDFRPHAEIVTK